MKKSMPGKLKASTMQLIQSCLLSIYIWLTMFVWQHIYHNQIRDTSTLQTKTFLGKYLLIESSICDDAFEKMYFLSSAVLQHEYAHRSVRLGTDCISVLDEGTVATNVKPLFLWMWNTKVAWLQIWSFVQNCGPFTWAWPHVGGRIYMVATIN